MNAQSSQNQFPKLHNAMWPGLVGKGSPGAEPCIDLDTMLDLTARAEVNGVRFDGVDLFLFDPHVSIEADDDALKRLADKIRAKGFVVGSLVAPVWPPTGGGSAMGTEEERRRFVEQVRRACRIGTRLKELGIRPYGVIRIDSACGVADWAKAPEANQAAIAGTFTEACRVAEGFGERLAAEGEICWGGMQSWRRMLDLLQRVNRPQTLGFQADMAHTLLYTLGYNAPEDAILPGDWNWADDGKLDAALQTLTDALRPWTLDFHVAQNDAAVHGSGTHDKTGHHCLPSDPAGKLNIPRHAGYWLRNPARQLTKAFRHICWDGCMFPNDVMARPETWNEILRSMIAVREAHGWTEVALGADEKPARPPAEVTSRRPAKRRKPAKKSQSKRAQAKPAKAKAKKKIAKAKAPARKKVRTKAPVRKKLRVKVRRPRRVKARKASPRRRK